MPEQPITTAAELLRQARRRSGLTQSEVADRACIAQSVVSEVERGRLEAGVQRAWVTGAVASGEESWSSRPVIG